jgi:hypothetical protein
MRDLVPDVTLLVSHVRLAIERIREIAGASATSPTAIQECDAAFLGGVAVGAKALGSGELDRA